jgi:hypothetical protein
VQLDAERRVQVDAGIRPTADSTIIDLQTLTARLGPDRWSLRRPTSVAIGDAYRVEDLLLESGAQRIEASGVVAPTGTQAFDAAFEQVRLRGIAPLLGLSGLGGAQRGASGSPERPPPRSSTAPSTSTCGPKTAGSGPFSWTWATKI